MLLHNRGSINVKDRYKSRPLHRAVSHGHESLKILLDKSADVDVTDQHGSTKAAVKSLEITGHAPVVQGGIIALGRCNLQPFDRGLRTPLHEAAARGHAAVINLLLEHKPEVDATDKLGNTALHHAVLSGHETILKSLLRSKANIKLPNKEGQTALHLAAAKGDNNMAGILIEKGPVVDTKDLMGFTPLFQAADAGHEKVVKTLIGHQANVNAYDYKGYGPLYQAAKKGLDAIVQEPFEDGAEVNGRNPDIPIGIAAYHAREAVVKLLIKSRTNLGYPKDGTPLLQAASQGHAPIVKILLDAGAYIYASDSRNYTALHKAVQNRRGVVVNVLLERKATIDSRTKFGYTALMLAAKALQYGIIEALVKHKANIHWTNKFALTAVQFAYAAYGGFPASLIDKEHSGGVGVRLLFEI